VEITEVKIYLRERQDRKLKAYATLTFDNAFVVRDIRVIDGRKGLFVAMPSRKLRESCPRCSRKNVIGSRFCSYCGTNLEAISKPQQPERQQGDARKEEHRDIAHPITTEARESIQKAVLEAFEREKAAAPTAEEAAATVAEAPPQPEQQESLINEATTP
jgi:stage V sporulation protein G